LFENEDGKELKMKAKSLWIISIVTAPEAEEAAAELLATALREPVSTHFDLETGRSTVTVYLQKKPAAPRQIRETLLAGLRRIKQCGLNPAPGRVTLAKLRRENWAESWKRHFPPIEIGRDLLIKPDWSRRRIRKNQAVVVLNPGLSFGTGQHPTTAFCLRELVRCGKNEPGRSFLDMGTGSGILAIAAAKLGYSPVEAFDFDPGAVRVARANARANGVHNKLRISRGDVTKLPVRPARQYDLICANLIAPLLMAERRRLVNRLRPAGTLVLAGILKSEFSQVRKVFAKLGLKLAVIFTRNEWRSGSFGFARQKNQAKFE
jgi:ribosomal protein L11 methyltransferase